MLRSFGPDIWIADGPVVMGQAGFHYPTRMAVIRLAAGELLVWSPVAITPDLRQAVDALGPVAHLVAPNTLHHTFLAQWHDAYPAARVWAVPELRQSRPDLPIHATIGPDGWPAGISHVPLRTSIATEAVLFHTASGTVLFCDLLQQFPPSWFRGWRGLVARLDLMVAAEPSVPRKFRVAFRDRRAAREAIATVLGWPARQVLMAHGGPVTSDAPAFLRRAFRWLTR